MATLQPARGRQKDLFGLDFQIEQPPVMSSRLRPISVNSIFPLAPVEQIGPRTGPQGPFTWPDKVPGHVQRIRRLGEAAFGRHGVKRPQLAVIYRCHLCFISLIAI